MAVFTAQGTASERSKQISKEQRKSIRKWRADPISFIHGDSLSGIPVIDKKIFHPSSVPYLSPIYRNDFRSYVKGTSSRFRGLNPLFMVLDPISHDSEMAHRTRNGFARRMQQNLYRTGIEILLKQPISVNDVLGTLTRVTDLKDLDTGQLLTTMTWLMRRPSVDEPTEFIGKMITRDFVVTRPVERKNPPISFVASKKADVKVMPGSIRKFTEYAVRDRNVLHTVPGFSSLAGEQSPIALGHQTGQLIVDTLAKMWRIPKTERDRIDPGFVQLQLTAPVLEGDTLTVYSDRADTKKQPYNGYLFGAKNSKDFTVVKNGLYIPLQRMNFPKEFTFDGAGVEWLGWATDDSVKSFDSRVYFPSLNKVDFKLRSNLWNELAHRIELERLKEKRYSLPPEIWDKTLALIRMMADKNVSLSQSAADEAAHDLFRSIYEHDKTSAAR